MAKRVGGFRRKTRSIYTKPIRTKGKISIRKYLQILQNGDRVVLKAEPAVQKGLYFRRYHGKSGVVKGKQGTNYKVQIEDHNATKEILVHPVHLKKQ